MSFLRFSILVLSFLSALSCQSTTSVSNASFLSVKKIEKPEETLEFIIQKSTYPDPLTQVSQPRKARTVANQPPRDWQEEIHQICLKSDSLCEFSIRVQKKKEDRSRQVMNEVEKALSEKRFADLKVQSVDLGLRFFSKYKRERLHEFADILSQDSSCDSINFRHALASSLEDYLPDFQVKRLTQKLYEQNTNCTGHKTAALSAYRAAMFRLLDNDCGQAVPLLQKVSDSNEDYLKPRAYYWAIKCKDRAPEVKIQSETSVPFFSYHRLLIAQSQEYNLETDWQDQTPVRVETKKVSELNQAARLAEFLLENEMQPQARVVLNKIRVEKVQETEPDFQVYWAYLLHHGQLGIKKFQILASLVNTYPAFRTRAVQSMLFPTWYFQHVEEHSKKIDPWLVQSLIRQESGFDPRAKSPVGATGLMQLMPATARHFSTSRWQLHDPDKNVRAGILFLEKLVSRFDGQVHMALAAYNAGPLKVEQWKKRYPTSDSMLFVDTIPYRETREYVAFILRNYHWYKSLNIDAEPTVTSVRGSLVRMATQTIDF
jgi:hypothetical protein